MHKFLIIQTAFTGDVVLATAIVEKLHSYYPQAHIDVLLRKGNEGLLQGHPHITEVLIWDKTRHKTLNLWRMALRIRANKYTHVINLHRFGSSGFVTQLSGAAYKAGFSKNPFSYCYTRRVKHLISEPGAKVPVHETDRNQQLIADITDPIPAMPALYPTPTDREQARPYQQDGPYICIAPSSVWFTKQFPVEKWAELINAIPHTYTVYLIGAPSDTVTAQRIIAGTTHPDVHDLCGKMPFLRSAALMQGAVMNYTNDSAPLHIASAMNAPVTAVFCSTVPAFGFGPIRPNGVVVETMEPLACRPCGLHGHKACPEGHFRCAKTITNPQLLWWIPNKT
ncbi:glycosyltransferase family 9 protein [Nemorincola caseinilytica]|uniref:Glycosyltransferase family 9 protein n=1 Tax=Nemorincola caseinilytica TaxID=2054315 RepID=A0ABP8NNH4_9BACT